LLSLYRSFPLFFFPFTPSRRPSLRSPSPVHFFALGSDADVDDPYKLTDEKRQLGLIVCRGTAVTLVCPCDGMMEIANPFLQE